MNHLIHILFFLCITASACGSSDNQVSKDAENSKSDTVSTESDTMKIQPPTPSLSPGTAQIQATIEKIEKGEDKTELVIHVQQLLRIGPSTPALPTEQPLNVNATSLHRNDSQKFNVLKDGKQFIITLGYRQSPENRSPNWILRSIETDTSTH